MSARCECVSLFNERLAEHNAQLVATLFGEPKVAISTCKLREGVRTKRPPVVMASYCPFCGEKYGRAALLKAEPTQ